MNTIEKAESIAAFYRRKMNWVPENLQREIGHFNVFRMRDFLASASRVIPFNRKDFYKISFFFGRNRYSYADKIIETHAPALIFSNPMVPYKCEHLEDNQDGYFCIFTDAFFSQFGHIREYPVFEPHSIPIFFPSEAEIIQLKAFFEELFTEMESAYTFKYDLIRAQILQVILTSTKMKPAVPLVPGNNPLGNKNANDRISFLFIELLERQFPIESTGQSMRLRMPVDFAAYLSVHINHLNRALKCVTGKTTSQLIAERILREANTLLMHSDWNIAQIGYCLGFAEPSRFIAFFRKHTNQTPSQYRK